MAISIGTAVFLVSVPAVALVASLFDEFLLCALFLMDHPATPCCRVSGEFGTPQTLRCSVDTTRTRLQPPPAAFPHPKRAYKQTETRGAPRLQEMSRQAHSRAQTQKQTGIRVEARVPVRRQRSGSQKLDD